MGRKSFIRIKISNKFLVLIVIIFVIISMTYLLDKKLKPTIKTIAQSKANLLANEIINRTIYEEILKDVNYHNLIEIHRDLDNKVTMIQADSIQISRLMSQTNIKMKEALNELNEQEFGIPLGQAIGSYLFATIGPKIKVKILPVVSELEVNLLQDFNEAGINQTRHMLYFDIRTAIKIAIPLFNEKVIISTKTPIAETIIVGPVPSTMVRLDGLNNLLRGNMYGQ